MTGLRDSVGMLAALVADPVVLAGSFAVAGTLIVRIVLQGHRRHILAGRAILFTLLSVALYLATLVPYEHATQQLPVLQNAFAGLAKLAWWLSAAWLSAALVRVFLTLERQPRDERLVQDLVVGIVYVGAVLLAAASVFSMPVGTVVATSGVFAVVLGLALQSTLGDVFSGVALGISGSYSIGDWIFLSEGMEGRVVETNWRATHLVNGSNDVVIIPNSALAKLSLTNFSSYDRSHGVRLALRFVPNRAPRSIVEVIRTVLLSSNTILRSPEPVVEVRALTATAIDIEVSCRVADMAAGAAARSELFDLAYRHARANGLLLAPSGNEAIALVGSPAPSPLRREDDLLPPLLMLEALPLFKSLSKSEIEALAETVVARRYQPDDVVVDQDFVLRRLVIIRRGVAIVTRRVGSQIVEVTRLSPGDSVGERGLLAGAGELGRVKALTSLLVFEIAEAGMQPLIHARPGLANELAATLARRSSIERATSAPSDLESDAHAAAWLLAQIRRLFAARGDS